MARTEPVSSASNPFSNKRILAPLVPYITVGVGLLVLHNAWIAILAYHLCVAIILFFVRRQSSFTQIHERNNYKILIVTFVLGIAGGLLLYLLWPLLSVSRDINLYLQNIGLSSATWPYFIAYFILINPWLEESYWRGYLCGNSKKITLNDALFSGYHIIVLAGKMDIIWLVIIFIILSLGAWFWRQANRWNQGIAASIVSHIAADVSVILAIYFLTIRI
jgi:uncharacterized protein